MGRSDKVQILLWINRNTDTKFRHLISQKYTNYEKGLLSYEAELALRNWIALHTNAQTPLNKPNPIPKVQIAFAQIKNYLTSNHYSELSPGQQINMRHIKEGLVNLFRKAYNPYHDNLN